MDAKVTDQNGERVIEFIGRAKNLSRVAELTHSIIEIAESGAWRDYRTAVGREQWLEAEFDYFLIACQLQRDDVARVLAWNRESATLAPLMEREAPPTKRRPFEEAALRWTSPGAEPLLARAKRLGWLNEAGRMAASPVPKRARTLATTGMTAEDHARKARAERIRPDRRGALDALAEALTQQLEDDLERRYVIDQLARRPVSREVEDSRTRT